MSMKKTELKIKIYGSSILRKKTKSISKITDKEKDLFDRMLHIMYENGGVGLAAPQVGLDIQMIVADIGQGPISIANPRITYREGRQVFQEGCLSVPGICVPIERARIIRLEGLNKEGKFTKFEAEDLMATCLQHEIDHLYGKLIVDYLPFHKRFSLRSRLKELKERSKNDSMFKSKEKSCKMQL